MKLSELIPYENNPRINENAVEAVAKSIKEFGFLNPIIIDKNNVIVAGHTRYKAAQLLGLTEVPCVVASELTEEQVQAFRIADNKTSELATWNEQLLAEELAKLDFDFTDFGFTDEELVSLTEDVADAVELPREEIGSASQLKKLKFGSKTIALTDDEFERFSAFYENFLTRNSTTFGLVLELLENGDKNYANGIHRAV